MTPFDWDRYRVQLEQIPNPSPALHTFIDSARAHIVNIQDTHTPIAVWGLTYMAHQRAWNALTQDERNTVKQATL